VSDLLTIHEAAERLRCSARQVRRLLDSGRLAAVVIGPRTRRIRPETLARYIEDAECQCAAAPIPATRNAHGSQRFTAAADALDAVLGLAPKPRHLRSIPGAGSSRGASKKPC
jgi:excisionase family DNA binding protein